MSENYQVMNENEVIDKIVATYFNFIKDKYLIKALECFVNKEGYGQEIVFVFFKNDLDEYDMAQLPKPLDDQHVLIELGYPAVEVDQLAYLDFKSFYNYLAENVKKEVKHNSDKRELMELLKKVKNSLGI
jgi:hypothetical protein